MHKQKVVADFLKTGQLLNKFYKRRTPKIISYKTIFFYSDWTLSGVYFQIIWLFIPKLKLVKQMLNHQT